MKSMNRRRFIGNSVKIGAGLFVMPTIMMNGMDSNNKPALLGGKSASAWGFSRWPIYDKSEESSLVKVLNSGQWGRLGGQVSPAFEKEYAKLLGVKSCLAVSSGTSALYTMLGALDIGPGDEVIIPVYTFVATYNVLVQNYALPVFVDTDMETFQIDANKIESAITQDTKILMPVHIGGSPADMDKILSIGKKHKLPIIEDACQAVMGEWKGEKLGSLGLGGAFSFQSSKNLNCAEGGAITSNDEDFIKKCYTFHNQGQGGASTSYGTGAGTRGTNLRITEFQSTLLLAQMSRLAEQAKTRSENAIYLSKMFNEIPGITPAKLYKGTTNSAYHLYMFRYDKSHFAGMSRPRFIQALAAEGIPCDAGYGQMNKDLYVQGLAKNPHYLKVYGEHKMKEWLERINCPQNDKLTSEQSLWFTQTMLLAPKSDMEKITAAVMKIQKNAAQLVKY
jgi:dTDP-4-amino-4,6-dideoxygalactose transaminase